MRSVRELGLGNAGEGAVVNASLVARDAEVGEVFHELTAPDALHVDSRELLLAAEAHVVVARERVRPRVLRHAATS